MNISSLQKHLTPKEAAELTTLQKDLHTKFMQGGTVKYFDEEFEVSPGVFPPRPDSICLVQGMVVNPGDRVLDVCCGSGVVGIIAAKRGVRGVTGLDINPMSVQCANSNAKKHNVRNYHALVSDVFSGLDPAAQFEVVTFNPPYRDMPTRTMTERTTWDQGLRVHKEFFAGVGGHLAKGGRIYFAQANFGPLDAIQTMLDEHGWTAELMGQRPLNENPDILFYGFEVLRK